MPSKLAPHWMPYHYAATDRDVLQRWRPPLVKIVWNDDPPHLDDVPPDSLIIVRHHLTSEMDNRRGFRDGTHAAEAGIAAAMFYTDMQQRMGLDKERFIFSGLNEPQVWGKEPPELTAIYYEAFLNRLHIHGLRGTALNLAVGWPTNHGITDAPPDWKLFEPVRQAMRAGDVLVVNEYWNVPGIRQNWRWWAGRYLQCPWQQNGDGSPLRIVIGECGIDRHVASADYQGNRGWQGNVPPEAYAAQLIEYDTELRKDPRVLAACIYTYDFSDPWGTFDIRGTGVMESLLQYADSVRDEPDLVEPPQEPPPDPPIGWIEDIVDDLPRHATKRFDTRPLSQITEIVLHHTGETAPLTPQQIARWHVNNRDWPGIAYHFYIRRDGKIYQTHYMETISYHAHSPANERSVAVCLEGDFRRDKQRPSQNQLEALSSTLSYIRKTLPQTLNVIPHKAAPNNSTECPGDDWYLPFVGLPEQELPEKPPSTAAIRWQAEEAVREIEALSAELERLLERGQLAHEALQETRRRLLDDVIAPLYRLEGVEPPE